MKMKNKPYPLYDVPYTPTFREFLEFCEKAYSDRTAFSFHRKKELLQKTYKQFYCEVVNLGICFRAKGCCQCKIAVMGENSYEWLLAYFAAVTSGNVIVPIDKSLPVDQVCYILRETEAKLFVLSDSYRDYADTVLQSGIETDIVSLQNEIPKWVSFGEEEADREGRMMDYDLSEPQPDDLAAIAYTSGTTGIAKGVMLTQRNICSNCYGGRKNLFVEESSILSLPLHHTYSFVGSVMSFMGWGTSVFINKSLKNLSKDMQDQHPSAMAMVPLMVETFYKRIWNTAQEEHKDKKLRVAMRISDTLLRVGIDLRRILFKDILSAFGGNLKQVICGGAALDEEYVKAFRSFGIQIIQGYGITECSPMVAVTRNKHYKDSSVGLKLCNVDVKINRFADSQEGEILVKGESVTPGYYKRPDLTKAAFDDDGYFKTGDVGYIDEDGFVYVTGRIKNIIILKNGKNVYPEELEFEWMKSPAVKEVLVYEKDDAIAVEILPDAEYFKTDSVDPATYFDNALADFNHHQPPHKNISQVILRDTPFPKTTTMKIKRNYTN